MAASARPDCSVGVCCCGDFNGNLVRFYQTASRRTAFPFTCMLGPDWPCLLCTYLLIAIPSVVFAVFVCVLRVYHCGCVPEAWGVRRRGLWAAGLACMVLACASAHLLRSLWLSFPSRSPCCTCVVVHMLPCRALAILTDPCPTG